MQSFLAYEYWSSQWAFRWANCITDLLVACGQQSKHNDFPSQKAMVVPQGERQIRRSAPHSSLLFKSLPNSEAAQKQKWWAWRLSDVCPSLQIIAVICFAGNQSCPLISPLDNTLIYFYPIAYQRIWISCWHIWWLQKHKTQYICKRSYQYFPGGPLAKTPSSQCRWPGFDPYSCLENSMDRGAWQATVHGFTKSQTQLSD